MAIKANKVERMVRLQKNKEIKLGAISKNRLKPRDYLGYGAIGGSSSPPLRVTTFADKQIYTPALSIGWVWLKMKSFILLNVAVASLSPVKPNSEAFVVPYFHQSS